jgi:hypothetical protein
MGWTVWDSPLWQQGIFSTPIQTGPGPHPAPCTMSAGYLSQGMALITYPHLAPRFKKRLELYFYSLYVNKIQRDATVCRCLFTAKLLYMFRASVAPIIRSTSNGNCSFWYRSYHVSEQQPSASMALATLAEGCFSDTVTCTRSCSYSLMYSWWWVR